MLQLTDVGVVFFVLNMRTGGFWDSTADLPNEGLQLNQDRHLGNLCLRTQSVVA